MSTRMYTLPVEQTRWQVPNHGSTTVFNWEYDESRDKLLTLYEKGKTKQWNASDRLDWTIEVDLSNPLGFPDYYISLYGSPIWEQMDEKKKGETRLHLDAWRFSQAATPNCARRSSASSPPMHNQARRSRVPMLPSSRLLIREPIHSG